jgi:hypothetical protein
MKKIHIIILAAAGILSFAGAFGVTSFVKKNQSDVLGDTVDSQQVDTDTSDALQVKQPTQSFPAGSQTPLKKRMQEDELRNLIVNVRETMEEHKYREKDIASQEERIQLARQTLLDDIDRLSKLNDQFKMTIADLKNREESLKNTLIEISTVEKKNLIRIAATYDKMDVTYSSTIIINMASTQQLDDAVKIIYLMSERVSAKLMGEISTTKPELACILTTELKKVKESE